MYSHILSPRPLRKRSAESGVHNAEYTILTRASSSRSRTSLPSALSHNPHSTKRRRSNYNILTESKSMQLEHVAQEKVPRNASVKRISAAQSATPSTWGRESSSDMKLRYKSATSMSKRLGVLNHSNHRRESNPIAVAIWVLQKIEDAKNANLASPFSSRTPSRITTRQTQRSPPESIWVKNSRLTRNSRKMPNQGTYYLNLQQNAGFRKKSKSNNQETIFSRVSWDGNSALLDSAHSDPFGKRVRQVVEKIAPKFANLEALNPGFGDKYFDGKLEQQCTNPGTVSAAKLLLNVLPALLCPEPSFKSQAAADALVQVLDADSCISSHFEKAFEVLSHEPTVARAADIIMSQVNASGLLAAIDCCLDGAGELYKGYSPTIHREEPLNELPSLIPTTPSNHPNSTLGASFPILPSHSPLQGASNSSSFASRIVTIRHSNSSAVPSTMVRTSARIRKPSTRALEAGLTSPRQTKAKKRPSAVRPTVGATSVKAKGVGHTAQNPSEDSLASNSKVVNGAHEFQVREATNTNITETPSKEAASNRLGPDTMDVSAAPPPAENPSAEDEFLVNQLLELASVVAAASGSKPTSDRRINIKALRRAYYASELQCSQISSSPGRPSQETDNPSENTAIVAIKSRSVTIPSATETASDKEANSVKCNEGAAPVPEKSAVSIQRSEDPVVHENVTNPYQQPAGFPLLSHPHIPRPWTDENGWVHTGRVNDYGEEISIVPDTYAWHRPKNTYNNSGLPHPPPRMKSRLQVEYDQIYGFPPLAGERNLPQGEDRPFVDEDIVVEVAKVGARKVALEKGTEVTRAMTVDDIERCVRAADEVGDDAYESAIKGSRKTDGPSLPENSSPTARKQSCALMDISAGTGCSKKRAIDEILRDNSVSRDLDSALPSEDSVRKRCRAELDAKVQEFSISDLCRIAHDSGKNSEQSISPQAQVQDKKSTSQEPATNEEAPVPSARGPGRPARRAAAEAATRLLRENSQAGQRRSTQRRSRPKPGSETGNV